jgi:hypothetical protein
MKNSVKKSEREAVRKKFCLSSGTKWRDEFIFCSRSANDFSCFSSALTFLVLFVSRQKEQKQIIEIGFKNMSWLKLNRIGY